MTPTQRILLLKASHRGPEIVRDGQFQYPSGTYWSAAGGASILGNGLWTISSSTVANPASLQTTGFAGGAVTVEVTVTVYAFTSGSFRIRFYNAGGVEVDGTLYSSVGTFKQTLTTATWDGRIGIFCPTLGSTLQLSRVSIRQVI